MLVRYGLILDENGNLGPVSVSLIPPRGKVQYY